MEVNMIDTIIVGLTDEELTTLYYNRLKENYEKMSALADIYSDMDSQYEDNDEEGQHGRKPF
jgi:hypothetical protein